MISDILEKQCKEIILKSDITYNDILHREPNFIYMASDIADTILNTLGHEKAYNELMLKSWKTPFNELQEEETEEIWWNILDRVEEYILETVKEEEDNEV